MNLSLYMHCPQIVAIAAASRYRTRERLILEMARDWKRLGGTHLTPVLYDARNGPPGLYCDVARATGLRLIPALMKGLMQGGSVIYPPWSSLRDMAEAVRGSWSWELAPLSDGLVVEDDQTSDTSDRKAFRAELSYTLGDLPLWVNLAASFIDTPRYLVTCGESRAHRVAPELYDLWRPDVRTADGAWDLSSIAAKWAQKLAGLRPDDGAVIQAFGHDGDLMATADAHAVTNWHYAPRPGMYRAWAQALAAAGVLGTRFFFTNVTPSDSWLPGTGMWDSKRLISGLTVAQSRAAFAAEVKCFA
jgi:hypothetical protein